MKAVDHCHLKWPVPAARRVFCMCYRDEARK
jgi:hypothetical protein